MTNTVNALSDAPLAEKKVAAQATGGVTVASYLSYTDAQSAVDHLADKDFPVQDVSVVGHGLTTVEQVTGKLTKGRAALAGTATGVWIGLLLGVLLGIFTPGLVWFSVLLTSILMGAVWGAVIGFVGHWASRGRRDFTSLRGLDAERYDLLVGRKRADEAARLLALRNEG